MMRLNGIDHNCGFLILSAKVYAKLNVGTFHLTVSHQEAGCCQRGQSAADNIGALLIHTLRLSRSRKSLVITVGIVNTLAVLLMLAALGIAVFRSRLLLDCFLLRTLAAVLMAASAATPAPAASAATPSPICFPFPIVTTTFPLML